jgi:GNAT superfamily N-acetyltransferase
VKVRDARPGEVPALARVWYDAWQDAHASILPADLRRLRTLESFAARLAAALPGVRVVGAPGVPVGFCIAHGTELQQLFVAASARGTGVATALVADAEARLAAAGVEIAWLGCAIGNERAARFYERRGWRRAGTVTLRLETSAGPFPLEVWRYEKRLSRVPAGSRAKRQRSGGRCALGVSIHTGWAVCVVVGGTPAQPEIVARERIVLLADAERFCFHMASDMDRAAARRWLARVREKALDNARRSLAPLLAQRVSVCAIVAKEGAAADLDEALASHARIHRAEGCFYRDVVREACAVPVRLVAPASLDASVVGRLAPPPWGRDHKLAALAAWRALEA